MAHVHPHPSERPLDYYERLEASVDEFVASALANTAAVTKGMSNVQRGFIDIGYRADRPFFSLESILQLPQKLAVAVCKLGDSIEELTNRLNKLLALTTIEPKEAWQVRLRKFLPQLRRELKEFVVDLANDIGLLVLGVS
eukprot:gene13796-9878_t